MLAALKHTRNIELLQLYATYGTVCSERCRAATRHSHQAPVAAAVVHYQVHAIRCLLPLIMHGRPSRASQTAAEDAQRSGESRPRRHHNKELLQPVVAVTAQAAVGAGRLCTVARRHWAAPIVLCHGRAESVAAAIVLVGVLAVGAEVGRGGECVEPVPGSGCDGGQHSGCEQCDNHNHDRGQAESTTCIPAGRCKWHHWRR